MFPFRPFILPIDARTRAAWQTQLAAARKTPGLLRTLVRGRQDLLPRFARYYQHLRTLSRRARRALQRRWRQSLAGVALLLTLGMASAEAATLTVTTNNADIQSNFSCSLSEAIINANDNAVTYAECPPSGTFNTFASDTIVLPTGSTQTVSSINNSYRGPNGLPVISSLITIQGNGSTIKRVSESAFRLFAIAVSGVLVLQDATVSGGYAEETIGGGGGVFSYGALTLTNSTISGNSAYSGGGGVYNHGGTLTLTTSTISGNSAGFTGGGVDNNGTVTLTNSTISNNSATEGGGGVYNDGTLTVISSTISGNSAYIAGGVINRGITGAINRTLTLTNSTVSGNRATLAGGGVYNFGAALTLIRTLISGNTVLGLEPSEPAEVYNSGGGVVIANNFNMFGINGFARVLGFSPGATDLVPSVTLGAILDTTLAANGGSTFNHALVTGSPAIDAVTAGCPPPATDQRGVTRPQGYFCDIGAFEATVCGNGAAEGLEQCDDGNLVEGDGCSATCVLEFCGDGEVDVGEECDDGNTMSGDGCSEVCQIEPPLDPCATPSDGCKVNGVANQPCVGTEGNDTISGTGGADVILGGGGNDTLRGGGGDDVLCGEAGDDTLLGLAGNDRLVGGEDDDNLNGGVGHDELEGGGGNDRLTGAGGADTLRGDDGDDTLLAGPGSDVLDGGAGADHLNGGGGVDQCTTDGEDVLVKQCE